MNDNLFGDAADDRNARADEDTKATNRHEYDFTGIAREEGRQYKEEQQQEGSSSRKRMRKKKLIPRIIMPR